MAQRMYTLDEPDDAIATLKADHQRVRELFQTYEHTRDPHLKQQIGSERRRLERGHDRRFERIDVLRRVCAGHRVREDGMLRDGVEQFSRHERGEALDSRAVRPDPFRMGAGHADDRFARRQGSLRPHRRGRRAASRLQSEAQG